VCGRWSLWRVSTLRGAGFPASLIAKLAAPRAAAIADRLLDGERDGREARARALDALRAELTREPSEALEKAQKAARRGRVPDATGTNADAAIGAWRAAVEQTAAASAALAGALAADEAATSAAVKEVAGAPLFREALVWQNRNALHTAIAPILRRGDKQGGASNHRRHEELVASYLQRYCTKNDTIGFFGPVGWARLGDPGEVTSATPGPALLAQRSVHFEQWPIDELAKKLAADPRMEPWMTPRRYPFVTGEGTTVRSPVNGKHTLTHAEATLLAASSGARTARELAASVAAEHPSLFGGEAEVFGALRALRDKQLIAWTLEVPLTWDPDHTLRALLARVGDAALRAEVEAPLDALDAARRQVVEAAGDAEALEVATLALEETFTRLTGAPPTRNAGAMYAARQLVFEDSRRSLEATIGHDVLEAVGPALSLLLASARWMTFEAARVCRERLRAIHADLSKKDPQRATVPFADVWFRAQRFLLGDKESPLLAITDELARRWATVLAFSPEDHRVSFDSASLAARVAETFAAPRPGWHQARSHSPDLMISAASVEAIREGAYEVVLGELHPGVNTLDSACLVAQHPDPEGLLRAYEHDFPERLALPVYSKDFLRITTRTNRGFCPAWHPFIENGFDVAPAPRDRVIALSALVVRDVEGTLMVEGPGDFALEIVDFLGENMSLLTIGAYHLLPRAPHTPRVTIDRLVVSRESWEVMPSTLGFASAGAPEQRFLEARRWARSLGLPRFVFVKSAIEVKPIYVDLDSPLLVTMFAKLARRTAAHVGGETVLRISEMLPGLLDTWVPDASGERYTSELRIVAVDEG
jgi:hypothetical protein